MKKLRLNLQGKEVLSKDQMKKISGGYMECNCPNGNYTQIGAPGECEAFPVDCQDECEIFCAG